jgi:hypothetical protein
MEASISSYSQARLFFSEQDLKNLEEKGMVTGGIERYATGSSDYFDRHKLPFNAYLVKNEDEIRFGGIPFDVPWEEKVSYEIAIMQRHIDFIRQKQLVYWDMLGKNIHARSIWISLEGVV